MQHSLPSQQPLNPVASFFKNSNLVLTVFDTRRGNYEGEEPEKLLSFFPTTAPIHVRTSIVGLAQAVTSFAASLAPDDSRFKSMVAEQNKWIMFEAEPCIWFLAVVRRTWATGTCTDAAFKSLLTSMYDVFVLLHGRMGTLLEQDPTGFAVRRVLQPLLDEVGSRLVRTEGAAAREPGGHTALLANPLAPHQPASVPLLATSHPTFLAVQCLVNQLLVASFYGSRLVSGVVVLWGGLPLWSTLGPEDTGALVTLAARALAPAARAAQRGRSAAAGASVASVAGGAAAAAGPGETAHDTLLSPLQWRAGGGIQPAPPSAFAAMAAGLGSALSGGSGGAVTAPSAPTTASSLAATAASILRFGTGAGGGGVPPPLPVSSSAASDPSGSATAAPTAAAATGLPAGAAAGVGSALPPFLSSFLRPRLRPSMYSPATAGGGTALALPLEGALPLANVWLRGSNEWAQLLPYHRGQLLVLALLHDGPPPATEVLAALAAVLNRGSVPAAAALAGEVPARSVWHEKGYRYCYTDEVYHASRYSPLKKVLTLTPSALRHVAHLRSKMDEWQQAAAAEQQQQQQQQRLRLNQCCQQQQHQQQQQEQGPEQQRQQESTGGNQPLAQDATAAASGAGISAPGALLGTQTDPGGVGSGGGGGGGGGTNGGGDGDDDAELVVRTANDAWAVLRAASGGRRLYCVSEQGPELTLASAVAPADGLCDRLFPGVFLAP